MKAPALLWLLLLALLNAGGCTGVQLRNLDSELNQLHSRKVSAAAAHQDTDAVDQDLVILANQARTAAEQERNLPNRVALYRVAAVAAWQAGDAGENIVLPVSDAGAAACAQLPQGDASAPRDCSLIRLAAPLAAQDQLGRDLSGYLDTFSQIERDHPRECDDFDGAAKQQCVAGGAKLPASEFTPLQRMFTGFDTQFTAVSGIAAGMAKLDVDPALKAQTERQRLIIYCNAVEAWSLSGDVRDANVQEFMAMAEQKDRMAQRLSTGSVQPDCQNVPRTEVVAL